MYFFKNCPFKSSRILTYITESSKLCPGSLSENGKTYMAKKRRQKYHGLKCRKRTSDDKTICAPEFTRKSFIDSPFLPTIKPPIFLGIINVRVIGTILFEAP